MIKELEKVKLSGLIFVNSVNDPFRKKKTCLNRFLYVYL